MFYTVSAPDNKYITPTETTSLKDAIKIKYALSINRPNNELVIIDCDGFIVSTREQRLYILQNLV